jgi:hypothetical protein
MATSRISALVTSGRELRGEAALLMRRIEAVEEQIERMTQIAAVNRATTG